MITGSKSKRGKHPFPLLECFGAAFTPGIPLRRGNVVTGPPDIFKRDQIASWPGSTAHSLLDRLWADEASGWQQMLELYAPAVYRWCRRFGLGPEDSADVAQEVFQAVAAGIETFNREQAGATFRGWLWRITRNKAMDFCRRQRGRPRPVGGDTVYQRLLELPDPPGEWSEVTDESVEALGPVVARAVARVRSEFESHTWRAFWESVVHGRPPRDVAEEVGVSVNAVYLARSRILRRLRRELGDLG